MTNDKNFDIIIIGGSYAGLSAAMTLGRSMRKVLILDSGKPCNQHAPHSHNFITQDGVAPHEIAAVAKQQVLAYATVEFKNGKAVKATKGKDFFTIETENEETFTAKKLLFATGVYDEMPGIPGFAECWGISIAHCPYCHAYEVRNTTLGVLANGDMAFEFSRMIKHWSKDTTLFTNGKSTLSEELENKLKQHDIPIVEYEIAALEHNEGSVLSIIFTNGHRHSVEGLFTRVPFKQHCPLPEELGCKIAEQGFIEIDQFQRTNVEGVYAAGDNANMFRTVSAAVAAGTIAGDMINKALIEESY